MRKTLVSEIMVAAILLLCIPGYSQFTGVKTLEITKEDMKGDLSQLSDLASKIQYIKLETNPEAFIGDVSYFKVLAIDKGFIIYHAIGKTEILLFGPDGSFIAKVGRLGKGPGEYNSSYKVVYDSFSDQVLVLNMNKVLFYDMKGKYQKTVFIDLSEQLRSLTVYDAKTWMLTYISPDNSGSIRSGVIWVDKQGKLLKDFDMTDNHMLGSLPELAHLNRILKFNGDIYYSMYNYTRYYRFDLKNVWTLAFEIKTPAPVIDETLITAVQKNHDAFDEWIRNKGFMKSSTFKNHQLWLYFTMMKLPNIVYDFDNKKIYRWSSDPVYKAPGIVNDIDGGPPVHPLTFMGENKIVELLDASQLLTYNDEGLLTKRTNIKSGSTELLNLVKQTKPDDNPIIRIVTLKR